MKTKVSHTLIRASAGTGKTHQLTNRYLRLIADGIEPDTMLATTFTRKAAGEILERILFRLADAAHCPKQSASLGQQLGLEAAAPQLFTAVLRNITKMLHRLRIGTLDSFYIALAGSCSDELGLPPGWQICEETDDAAWRREALDRLLEKHPDRVGELYSLLSKGEYKRSVETEIEQAIANAYVLFRSSSPAAWTALKLPKPLSLADCESSIAALRGLDLSCCGDKRIASTRDQDVERFLEQDFESFVRTGLAAKVVAGETKFQRGSIPPDAFKLYQKLLQHARYHLLKPIAEQTAATRELLQLFHGELWSLKQAHGGLRFDDVTFALVEAIEQGAIPAETMAFRLDGAVDHLLLDEFQDTSLSQWRVIEPIARRIREAAADEPRSFVCVGDVKQAIYGWRGGVAAIFERLAETFDSSAPIDLVESRRSSQAVIDAVNMVFSNLSRVDVGDKNCEGLIAWSKRFVQHTTCHKDRAGYVRLESGPEQTESMDQQRHAHCEYVAQRIRAIRAQAPGRTIGVLCRKNDFLARMIFELRRAGVEASEEGGNTLADSAAVEVILSLMTLADHPEHSVAWFHLLHSPLSKHLETNIKPAEVSSWLRRELNDRGFGPFVLQWAQRLADACDARERRRLQQLVEAAFDYPNANRLRAGDFVQWIRARPAPAPSAADVRVMTIHGAKGLQFDITILPQLDAQMVGDPPMFVAGRNAALETTFVCRSMDERLRNLLEPDQQEVFSQWRCERVEESLSLLYVAMTRAIHALYMFVPGDRDRTDKQRWHQVLCDTLASGKSRGDKQLLAEFGDANWYSRLERTSAPTHVATQNFGKIDFLPAPPQRRRGLNRVAPSRRHVRSIFDGRQSNDGTSWGSLVHAWFALIEWLDDGAPTDAELRDAAMRLQDQLPARLFANMDRAIADFRAIIAKPQIQRQLSRPVDADRPPTRVERERTFLVRHGDDLLAGSIDRLVWFADGAEILDFKTDAVTDPSAFEKAVEFYRAQLDSYRDAVALMTRMPKSKITMRLVFTHSGVIVPL